jgi:CHAT domain-containing protein
MVGAQHESQVLNSFFKKNGLDTVYLQGKAATLKNISKELGISDIVHFATHGFFNAVQPENSGLLLGLPENGLTGDGLFFLHNQETSDQSVASAVGEIFTLNKIWQNIDMFSCRLLNLSACSTAMVDWSERSDEFYGIANGFLYAGVQNILSNLFPTHDFFSQVFNMLYYEELLINNCTAITALKNSIKRLKEYNFEGTRPFIHPFFWAGYRVIGFS